MRLPRHAWLESGQHIDTGVLTRIRIAVGSQASFAAVLPPVRRSGSCQQGRNSRQLGMSRSSNSRKQPYLHVHLDLQRKHTTVGDRSTQPSADLG